MSSWNRVRVEGPNARRAIMAGVIATLILTGLMYLGPLVGIRVWNIPQMIGGAMSFNEHIVPGSPLYIWGVCLYAIFCAVALPLCYAYWIYSYLPGPTWMRGLIWGGFLWFLVEMLVMPLIGQGVFDWYGPGTAVEIISQFVLWVAYGVVFGFIAGPQEVWAPRQHQERHA